MNSWLLLPHTVYTVSITDLKCFRNFTQKPFEIMLKMKNISFFFLSVYLFPSGELFLLGKGSQNEMFLSCSWEIVVYPKGQRTQWKNYRTSKIAMRWYLLFFFFFFGSSLLNQNLRQRSNAHLMWEVAIGLKQHCINSQMLEKSNHTATTSLYNSRGHYGRLGRLAWW